MKLVAFTRDMAPYVKGETRAVPDELADRLIADGDAEVRASVFDAAEPAAQGLGRQRLGYRMRKGL